MQSRWLLASLYIIAHSCLYGVGDVTALLSGRWGMVYGGYTLISVVFGRPLLGSRKALFSLYIYLGLGYAMEIFQAFCIY